jgi:hypothetical protein
LGAGRHAREDSSGSGRTPTHARAYDSDPLDAEFKRRGIDLVAPHHPKRHRKTQDGRPLRRYRRRWHVERLIAWLLRNRRVHTRYEVKAGNFLGFIRLACLRILLRYS